MTCAQLRQCGNIVVRSSTAFNVPFELQILKAEDDHIYLCSVLCVCDMQYVDSKT